MNIAQDMLRLFQKDNPDLPAVAYVAYTHGLRDALVGLSRQKYKSLADVLNILKKASIEAEFFTRNSTERDH